MRIISVTLEKDQRLNGALPMKTYRTSQEHGTEVHYDPDMGVVVVTKKDAITALVVPISKCEHLELPSDLARAIVAPPKGRAG